MSNVQSLERALTLLNVLSEYPEGIQITRLSEQVGLSKSTTHRLLATLVHMNYVVKDEETEKYKLGFQLIYLSRNILNSIDVIQIARPFLEKLCHDVNETIHLCIDDNGEVMYIDKIESNQTIRMFSRIGSRAPMYCTGVGKVLLSGMSEETYRKVVSGIDFVARTAKTITSADALAEEVALVKNQGYALDNIENEEGIRCIAAPIFDFQGKIIASFSISGPSNRITMERVQDELVRRIRETSQEISRQLGYRV
ncbi:IclR family transcriptional regulator [Brevibacillus panacihumi W25]|uniref:Glycerol operon regulatory protein n=1 Tax=Brevibacillus panacihumi W25 TaxID=1408254 RepID=V6M238_9BACL|nr:IclR family transcriptional regulator [Brevibacillus panacihumi]EST51975.1 IclR family transcriptional regulator [Brevibacillus panacihumi W25]